MTEPPHTRAAWITFGVLLVASLLLVTGVFGALWKPLFLAAVLASTLWSWHEKLAGRLRQRRNLSSTIFTLGVVVLILLPLVGLSVVIVREAIDATNFVKGALESGGTEELVHALPSALQSSAQRALDLFKSQASSISSQVAQGGQVASALASGAARTGDVLLGAVLMLIALRYLLSDGHRLADWVRQTLPLQPRQTGELMQEFRKVSKSVLGSMVVTAAAQAAAASIGYLIARVPQPLFFGLLTFITAFIPSVGTAVVALPIAALLLILGHPWYALFLALWAVFVVGLVDNLLKPILIKSGMNLHGVIVFFALLGGVFLLGPVGLIAGPLSVAFFLSMIRLWQRDFSAPTYSEGESGR